MTDTTGKFVAHALSRAWDDMPAEAQQAARYMLHDSIAVGIAGRNAALADAAFSAAQGWSGSGGSAFILGRKGERFTAPHAAFVNGYQIHSQEFDCVHEPAVAHPMASVGAVLLAEATRAPLSGKNFLAAMVAGVDIVASLGVAVQSPLKFFRPATAGIFGSIGALSRARQVSADVAANGFGYGLAFASGTMQAHVEGKPTLAVQVAGAARSAIEAFDLARAGFEGPRHSFDGPFGYLSLFEDKVDLEPVLADLGQRHRIAELSWKPFPTGRAAHGAIVALIDLMQKEGVTAQNLERFEYRAPPLIHRLVGRRPVEGMTVAYARLCFAWLAAVILKRGSIGLDDFQPSRLNDPEILTLAQRIHVIADDNPDYAAFVPALGVAVMADGRRLERAVAQQLGSPEWPLTEAQHLEKAQACLSFGGMADLHEPLWELVQRFETLDDVGQALIDLFEG